MKVGFQYWVNDRSISVVDLARSLEERNFASLWLSEHSHIPVSRRTPWPQDPDASLPMSYIRMHDPLIALAAAAAVTTRLTLATGICLLAQRDPLNTAKQVASIDHIAEGRFIFGVGYGWNFEELENHGIDPAQRRDIVREKVEAMRALWSEEVAEYHGDFVHFTPSWQWPKPVQRSGPPVVLGTGKRGFREIARWADGWVGAHHDTTLSHEIPLLRQRVEEAGRDPDAVAIHIIHTDPSAESLDAYEEAGVETVILFPPPWLDPELENQGRLLNVLDDLAPLVNR